jgi:outer membrane protein OmpA-like peptidoglycan-associated protein
MNQDELREALLAALLDYETFKKTRRLKAFKKALRGTMMATVIGSAGFTAANEGRNNQVRETTVTMASKLNAMSAKSNPLQETSQHKVISGAAFFAFDRHTLEPADEEEIIKLSKQLPKDAELTVIGCTDSLGVQHYNKKLATQRAQAVASYLARQGIKIKAIEGRISKNKHASWLQRRVDIVVDSALAPLAINLTSLEKQHSLQQSQPQLEPQTPLHAFDYHDKEMRALQETEKRAVIGSTKSAEAKSDEGAVIAKTKPEQPARQRQIVRGVTHFAMNSSTLASAHKERLMELI